MGLNEELKVVLRDATAGDVAAINEIYNYYVAHCTCTYQEEADSLAERMAWFEEHDAEHPVIVAEAGGEIVGWGSLSRYGSKRGRNAYRFTVEDSVYVRHDIQRRGVGKAILSELLRRAEAAGYRSVIASISADRTASVGLHEKFGFEKIGHFREVGTKFDRWLDVVYLQKQMGRGDERDRKAHGA